MGSGEKSPSKSSPCASSIGGAGVVLCVAGTSVLLTVGLRTSNLRELAVLGAPSEFPSRNSMIGITR
jgi:hypothetical protein